MIKFLVSLVVFVGCIYAALVAMLYILQRKLQYFPSHRDVGAVGGAGFLPWSDDRGNFLGYYRPCEKPRLGVLIFHGNGGEALDRAWLSEVYPEDTYQLVLSEFPGYGPRSGEPSERTLFAAGLEAFDEAQKKWGIPFLVIGESLGTGVAVYVASQRSVERLALISPFSSALDVAKQRFTFIPIALLMRDRFESDRYVKQVKAPIHIIHGTMDEVVPLEFGKKLHEAVPGKKKLTEIPGYGHSNIHSAVTDSPFADEFRAFVRGE